MWRIPNHRAVALSSLLLASCSGGSSAPPPPAPNRPPAFTSSATATVPENSAGTVYNATASDPDGNALTFSIAGGADAARFAIAGASGALSFVAPPDFEMPTDSDANNVYLVRLSVSDGQANATLDLAVTVTNAGADAFRVRRSATGFNQPLFLTGIPDATGRVFVVEKGGLIRILNPATGAINVAPFLDVSGQISTDGERGLLGLALAPDYATTGTFYVYLTNPAGTIELRKYRTQAGNRDAADTASADVILTILHPGANNHNGGWIDFGNDNFLYIAVGDGGGSGDPTDNAQNPASLLGKMLRIDPSRDDFPGDAARDYAIPVGNRFAIMGGAPEVWALGLRNPFRNSFDRVTGNLYIGDVGQNAIEEIDLALPGDTGLNFGWAVREGTQLFKPPSVPNLTPPVTEYTHGNGALQGMSVTGGYVYRGPIESLRGQYFFGDFISSNIWSVPAASLVQGQTLATSAFIQRRAAFAPNIGTIGNIPSFGIDQTGNLYIVDFDGEIFVVEPA